LNKADLLTAMKNQGLHLNIAITYLSNQEQDFSAIQEKVKFAVSKIVNTFNEHKEQK